MNPRLTQILRALAMVGTAASCRTGAAVDQGVPPPLTGQATPSSPRHQDGPQVRSVPSTVCPEFVQTHGSSCSGFATDLSCSWDSGVTCRCLRPAAVGAAKGWACTGREEIAVGPLPPPELAA